MDSDGSVSWYRYPDWTRFIIKDGDHIFGDGIELVDLDSDGDLDVVTAKGNDNSAQVWWFRNPGGAATEGWTESRVAEVEVGSEVKDLYVADVDHDGKPDVAVRTKHFFALYFQEEPEKWTERKIENREREGMKLADIDEDGDYDAIMNGYWFECPADPRKDEWPIHVIDEQWFTDVTGGWQDHSVRIAIGDFDADASPDVGLLPLREARLPGDLVLQRRPQGRRRSPGASTRSAWWTTATPCGRGTWTATATTTSWPRR